VSRRKLATAEGLKPIHHCLEPGVIGLWFGDDMVDWYLDEFFPGA